MEKAPLDHDSVVTAPLAETVAATPLEIPASGARISEEKGALVDARYVVGEQLGEGGMGKVWLCHDQSLGRDVAQKRMRFDHAFRDDLRTRFAREARVQGRIEHPSIVPLYDLELASGIPRFTMKQVRGPTLSEILDRLRAGDGASREAYSRHKLLAAFASVCLTVDLAHAHGVVHRDLKPDNIMLGSYGELYVLDWGVAKVAGERDLRSHDGADADASRTRAGALLGTVGYMAHEQLDKSSEVDERADVYALGAILFEMVTLQPLHTPKDLAQVVKATVNGIEARPSVRVPGCDTSPELDAICARATARDREDRYASVRELYEAVEVIRVKDRDLEQRRARAMNHARIADAAAKAAEVESDPKAPQRTLALREASLALALDPTHAGAFDTIGKLLANPPRVLPEEVDRKLEAATKGLTAATSRGGSLLLLTWFAYLPGAMLLGIRNVPLYATVSILFMVAALVSYFASKKPPADGRARLSTLLFVGAPLASLATVWSPLVLEAPVAVIFAVAMIVVARTRAWPIREAAVACGIIAAPVALAVAGVIPPSIGVHGGTMLILPVMIALPATLTVVVSTMTLVLVVVSIFAWTVHLKNELTKAERTLYLYAWHLRQVLKPETLPGQGVRPPAPPERAPDELRATVVATSTGRMSMSDPLGDADRVFLRYDPKGEVSLPSEGRLFLYEDRRIGRTVALKMVQPEAGEDERKKLCEEARIRARLQHPAIPPLYDAAEDPERGFYFTMRRPRGISLPEAISVGHHSLHRLIEAFSTACQAVEYAHANQVVHRRLSAECVMLGDYGEVYVTGWGSACQVDDVLESSLVRADVAALSGILASILTAAQAAVVGGRPAGALVPEGACVPPELEAISTRPGGFASAGELHAAVVRFLEGERDVAQRTARVVAHLAVADEAAARAFAAERGGAEERAVAMRAVTQALALDPANVHAGSTLMKLLTVPPRTLPAEAEQEIAADARRERRRAARIALPFYLTWFVCVPFLLVQPDVSKPLVAAVSVVFLGAIAALWRVANEQSPAAKESFSIILGPTLSAAALGAAAGPLVLVPTIVIGNMIAFVLYTRPRRRLAVLALSCLAFVGPLVLQALGVISPFYTTQGDSLVIVSHLFRASPLLPILLSFAQVMVILAACVFFRRFRDARNRAEERLHLNNWQLRQLVSIPVLP